MDDTIAAPDQCKTGNMLLTFHCKADRLWSDELDLAAMSLQLCQCDELVTIVVTCKRGHAFSLAHNSAGDFVSQRSELLTHLVNN